MPKGSGKDADLREIPVKLAVPARRALANAQISTLEQLAQRTKREIEELHGIGPNAVKQLQSALKKHGLSFLAEN